MEIENKKKDPQFILFNDFEDLNWWKEYWKNMPEYIQEDLSPIQSVIIHFESEFDRDKFSELISQKITSKTKSLWYPKADIVSVSNIRYVDKK